MLCHFPVAQINSRAGLLANRSTFTVAFPISQWLPCGMTANSRITVAGPLRLLTGFPLSCCLRQQNTELIKFPDKIISLTFCAVKTYRTDFGRVSLPLANHYAAGKSCLGLFLQFSGTSVFLRFNIPFNFHGGAFYLHPGRYETNKQHGGYFHTRKTPAKCRGSRLFKSRDNTSSVPFGDRKVIEINALRTVMLFSPS